MFKQVTDEILEKQKLAAEARAIRKEWIKRGITKGDVDHNTCQLSIDGVKKRYDCFKIDGGIPEPEGEAPPKEALPRPQKLRSVPPQHYESLSQFHNFQQILPPNSNLIYTFCEILKTYSAIYSIMHGTISIFYYSV